VTVRLRSELRKLVRLMLAALKQTRGLILSCAFLDLTAPLMNQSASTPSRRGSLMHWLNLLRQTLRDAMATSRATAKA